MLYYARTIKTTEARSDRFMSVNNFGYEEESKCMDIRREKGRIDYQLIYVKSGAMAVQESDGLTLVRGGDICLFRPNEPQIYRSADPPPTLFWVHFSGTEAESMLTFFKRRCYHIGAFPEFERYCHGFLSEMRDETACAELFYVGELIALIARIGERVTESTEKRADSSRIRPALLAMRSNVSQRLSNDELASLCGLSRFYFLKLFKRSTGFSPQQYYTDLVIDNSCFLLTTTAYNVSEIARQCGIEDSLYFSRLFKKHTGLSPTEYRKKIGKEGALPANVSRDIF